MDNRLFFNPVRLGVFGTLPFFLILWLMLSAQALAGEGKASGNVFQSTMLPGYLNECASCHIAYPPGMLPKKSWKALMQTLDSHYGVEASLDLESVKEIGAWLEDHSGTYKRGDLSPAEDRITQSAWFVRKHRKIHAQVWIRPSIKSPANCVACHTLAEHGDYRERTIVIPKN